MTDIRLWLFKEQVMKRIRPAFVQKMNKVKVVGGIELETIPYIIVDLLLITTQHKI